MDKNGNKNPTEYAEQFEALLNTLDYTMDKLDDGSYAVWDTATRNYVQIDSEDGKFENAQDVADRLSAQIEERIIEAVRDGIEEVLPSIDPKSYENSGIKPPEDFPSADVKELNELLKKDQILRDAMITEGWDSDIGYIDLLANHLEDVNFDRLFEEKYFDKITIDENDADAVIPDNGNLNVHLSISDDVLSELLRNSDFEFGEQTEDVKYRGLNADLEAAGIEYGDLYVDFDMSQSEEPAYTLVLQMTDDSKKEYINYDSELLHNPDGRLNVPDTIKAAVNNAVEQYHEGKSLNEILDNYKAKEDKEID